MGGYYVTYTDSPCDECNKCTQFCDIVYNADDGCKIDIEFCTKENKSKVIQAANNCPQKRIVVIDE